MGNNGYCGGTKEMQVLLKDATKLKCTCVFATKELVKPKILNAC
jgi:hypothetical protein